MRTRSKVSDSSLVLAALNCPLASFSSSFLLVSEDGVLQVLVLNDGCVELLVACLVSSLVGGEDFLVAAVSGGRGCSLFYPSRLIDGLGEGRRRGRRKASRIGGP